MNGLDTFITLLLSPTYPTTYPTLTLLLRTLITLITNNVGSRDPAEGFFLNLEKGFLGLRKSIVIFFSPGNPIFELKICRVLNQTGVKKQSVGGESNTAVVKNQHVILPSILRSHDI